MEETSETRTGNEGGWTTKGKQRRTNVKRTCSVQWDIRKYVRDVRKPGKKIPLEERRKKKTREDRKHVAQKGAGRKAWDRRNEGRREYGKRTSKER